MTEQARHIERIAASAARFRRVNEGIAGKVADWDVPEGHRHGFICECVMSECTDEVMLTMEEYRDLRATATWFAVCPEHVMPVGEHVVRRTSRYWIVEKIDGGRRVAEEEPAEPASEREAGVEPAAELVRAVQAARWQEGEYEQALAHYVQLMRHRLANPLTAISGLAQTLLDLPDLGEDTKRAMLRTIVDEARGLLEVSLDPRREGDEERELSAEPFRRGRWFR